MIKDTPLSKIWLHKGYIYKWQPKFLTDNEIWCLEALAMSGFVPIAERVELEIIRMEKITDEPVTNARQLLDNTDRALRALSVCGIRHGDLTRPNVLIRDNKPILLDFSESRFTTDTRPDKRPEGDRFWLKCTIQGVLLENS